MSVALSPSIRAHVMTAAQPFMNQTFRQLMFALAANEQRSVMLSVHGNSGVGGVFIDQGRIAWAAAPGTRRFLSDRLAAAGVDGGTLDALVRVARATHTPLGRLVVQRGLMGPAEFAGVLQEHTVASLREMASQRIGHIDTQPRREGTFAMADTFPVVPLLTETVRRLLPSRLEPDALPDPELVAVEVAVVDGAAYPVRVVGARTPNLSALLPLTGEAQAVMEHVGTGTASFRRGARCWSVSGTPTSFVVSEGRSALSFAWMLSQGGL